MKSIAEVRPSPIAGQWYEGEKRRLAAKVDGYIDAAKLPEIVGEVVAVMAPHAGHVYSGPVAGYAFKTLRSLEAEVVVVCSPSHYPYSQKLLTTAHSAYQTPLGDIPVDQAALSVLDGYLQEELGFSLARVAYDEEHSLEIELPFLQRALNKEFLLIPIMVREQSVPVARGLGKALGRLFKEGGALAGKTRLLVASTDLSHFYPQAVAETLDAEVLRQVEAFDPEGVMRVEEEGKGFACGRGALAAVLWAAKELGANHVQVLHHATSGDVTGDTARVVGYGAAVVTRKD
jgi:AmmeMemoRadiSam system protein B